MRRFYVLGIALLAMFAFSALEVAVASAATFLLAEWLLSTAGALTGTLEANSESNALLFEDTSTLLGRADVECSGVLMGTIGPNGADEITSLLDLSTNEINKTELTEPGLSCTTTTTASCTEPLVWAVNLPWVSTLELMEEGNPTEIFFADLLKAKNGGEIGWEVECMTTFGKPVDKCTVTEGVSQIHNGAEATFAESFTELAGLKLAKCTQSGGQETGIVEGSGTIKPDTTETLTGSSETSHT